jgi:PAS domain S-box-containing protein
MMDTAIVMADRDGRIVFWSPGAEAAFGYPASDAIGQSLDLIVPAEFQQDHWKGFRQAIESGAAAVEGQTSPFPVRVASGEVAPTPGRLTLVRRPDGAVVGAVVAFASPPDGRGD